MTSAWTDKAAALTCIGVSSSVLGDPTRRLIDRGVGGVLLYEVSFERAEEAHGLIDSLKSYAGRELFVAIDHEGGARSRLTKGFTRLPPLHELGKTRDAGYAREVGRVLGRELRAIGVDVCLGPVLDVATHPENPVIGERSLGADPLVVAELGTAVSRGLQEEGVAACGKHFPGHGDTVIDSNHNLPVLPHGVDRMEDVELVPFTRAVEGKIAAMLVGHILFRALDPHYPASMSRPILYGLLRQRLGYRGLVITDDVDMGALTKHFPAQQIAEKAIAAGADCFLCARRPETALDLIEAIGQGVERGTVLPERVEAARRRVDALLHRYASRRAPFDASRVGPPEHARLLERIGGGRPSLVTIDPDE